MNRFSSPRGIALTEFAIIVPLFLLVTLGVIVLGRTLAQWDWFQQTGYNAVRKSAEVRPADAARMAEKMGAYLADFQDDDLKSRSFTGEYDAGSDSVRMMFAGAVSDAGSMKGGELGVMTEGPNLLIEFTEMNPDGFENIIGRFYNCQGLPCSVGGNCPPSFCP